jgi:uncharacterized protein YkwD
MKRLLVLLAAFAVAFPSVTATSGAPRLGAPHLSVLNTATADYCMDSEEQAFLQLINNYRAQNGLGALVAVQTAGAAADHHSIDMATNNYFSHTLFDGTMWSQNLTNHGYTNYGGFRGENIAGGYSTATSVLAAWKASSAHNANMLNANFLAIGIGRAYGATSTYKWYWTTTFGGYVDGTAALCGAPAPTPTNTPAPSPTPVKTATPLPSPTNTPQPSPTNTPQPAPTNTPQPTATASPTTASAVYVAGMTGKAAKKRSSTTISLSTTIADAGGQMVRGASVTIVLAAPDGSSQTLTATTNSRGLASWSVAATHGIGTYVASVTSVTASGRAYDPSRNTVSTVAVPVT